MRPLVIVTLCVIPVIGLGQAPERGDSIMTGGESRDHVAAGDTLTSIGARYGVESGVLARRNDLRAGQRLSVGQALTIDNRHLVPSGTSESLVINIPQRMLFQFRDGRREKSRSNCWIFLEGTRGPGTNRLRSSPLQAGMPVALHPDSEVIMDATRSTPSSPPMRPARFRVSLWIRTASMIVLAVIVNAGTIRARAVRVEQSGRPAPSERSFPIPMSIVQQHAMIVSELNTAAALPGQTGVTARRVLTLVMAHFKDEQRRVHPLLYVLPMVAARKVEPWMADLVPMAERLRGDIDEIRRAHVVIDAALDDLYDAAWRESHQEYAFLAMRIRHHNQFEEEIAYPAALVVGEELQFRFPTPTARRQS